MRNETLLIISVADWECGVGADRHINRLVERESISGD